MRLVDRALGDTLRTMRDYLATRRTVTAPFLNPPAPNREELDAILTIAARVPDHGKLAPWRFIVFAGDKRHAVGEAMAQISEQRGAAAAVIEADRVRFARAPLVVAVVSTAAPHRKIPEWEQILSAGAVCLNLIHAAAAFGYRAQWLTEWVAYDNEALAALGIRETEKVAGFIHIGTSDAVPADRARPDLSAIVEHYGV